jgi:RNA polymerase sigma-70 factor (ECF subfamily)
MGFDDETPRFLTEIARLRPVLLTRARRLCPDEAGANDLVQSALERALRRRTSFREGSVLAWTMRIMQNLFIDECRRCRRNADTPVDQLAAPEVEPTFIEEVLDVIDAADLRGALGRLAPSERELFELAYFQQWPRDLIAARLGLRLNTTGTRLFRVKQKVRNMLQSLLAERTATVALRPLVRSRPSREEAGKGTGKGTSDHRPVPAPSNTISRDRRHSASG